MRRQDGKARRGGARRGAVAVLVAISLVAILGVTALVLDGGVQLAERRHAQAVADSAALAAACSLYSDQVASTAQASGKTFAAANGYANDEVTSTVAINIPPLSGAYAGLLYSGSNTTVPSYAEAVVRYNQPRLFSALWGPGTMSVSARSVAHWSKTTTTKPAYSGSVLLLDTSAQGALTVQGSASLTATAGVQVNSNNSVAVLANNNGKVNNTPLSVVGGVSSVQNNPWLGGSSSVTTGAVVADPLASLSPPNPSSLTARSMSSYPSYGTYSIDPGYYANGISFGGGSNVTMKPGTYYVGSGGFTINNGVPVTDGGQGVTFFMGPSGGAFNIQGGSQVSLSAPSSGTYAGLLVYQGAGNTNSPNVANGTTSTLSGTVYTPGAAAVFAGGANYNNTGLQFIAKTMNLTNNTQLTLGWDSTKVYRSTATSRTIAIIE